jgi:hypothetical protein
MHPATAVLKMKETAVMVVLRFIPAASFTNCLRLGLLTRHFTDFDCFYSIGP